MPIIQITHNDVFHEHTKYIEINCHFVCYNFLHGTLQLCTIAFLLIDQIANVFTKAHPPRRFCDLVSKPKLASTLSHSV
jgi:hypothetical protein